MLRRKPTRIELKLEDKEMEQLKMKINKNSFETKKKDYRNDRRKKIDEAIGYTEDF